MPSSGLLTKLLVEAAALVSLCAVVAWPSPPSPKARVSIRRVEQASCPSPSTMRMTLQAEFENLSGGPLVFGRVEALQQRFYSEGDDGKLSLMRTSDTADDFEPRDIVSGEFPAVQEQLVPAGVAKVLTVNSYIYLQPSDAQIIHGKRQLIVSFHITNLRRDGSASTYWMTPLYIRVPDNCETAPGSSERNRGAKLSQNPHSAYWSANAWLRQCSSARIQLICYDMADATFAVV